MRKITITSIPNDMTDEAFVTNICDQDAFIDCEINYDETFSVMKSWTSKRYTGTQNLKNVMIKCFMQIRKHIMKDNDGCVYMGLSRRESFDHFFVPHCYHCYRFNHFTDECSDKDMPATCANCAGHNKIKVCNRNSLEKCVNCV